MMLFRSARNSDLDAIHDLAEQSGIGMTTLPKDKELLNRRLNWSSESFEAAINAPRHEYYLFVMEDLNTHKVIGTSAIEARTGGDAPFILIKYLNAPEYATH